MTINRSDLTTCNMLVSPPCADKLNDVESLLKQMLIIYSYSYLCLNFIHFYSQAHVVNCKYRPQSCPNACYGCEFKGTKEQIENHLHVCEFQLRKCEHCRQEISLRQYQVSGVIDAKIEEKDIWRMYLQ